VARVWQTRRASPVAGAAAPTAAVESVTGAEHPRQGLTPVEREVVDLFVRLCRLLGQPASFGQIYGLLFVAPQPLTMDDLVERLGISKGSASQGLRFLHGIGAVRKVLQPGNRRAHYVAVTELRRLAARFLRERIEPRLRDSEVHLDRISTLIRTLPGTERDRVADRVRLLRSWHRNGRRLLPVIQRILGG
jgi:DNA-binding transcriptional regulator GbsR (MarR family)